MFASTLEPIFNNAGYHYRWRRYVWRCYLMHRKFPESVTADYADRAADEMDAALAEAPMPAWAEWLVRVFAWNVQPVVAPFGSLI